MHRYAAQLRTIDIVQKFDTGQIPCNGDSILTQTLETASIAATEAVLVTHDYRIPVAFQIYESEKIESENTLIAYEVQEYFLWSAINGAFGWPTSKELMTNSRLSPAFAIPNSSAAPRAC